ncbi:hypothetical protein GPA22_02655 [Aromatoleum toluvorans]|uniref:THIF-type NAD/FAD binding fold domain-containing protein n=1 Tax=Aromatoleum toluvorans TaxID=92002 RepID=A0ABX1PT61_9RHOO|nr:ThiF family adenylyltransferase [Aromatoleum toluvorans]NMG42634.1 hypothetical protein [Aromatoleum toluvorans]
METWWGRYPEALEAEKTALSALGYPWSVDEAARQAGRLIIRVQVPNEGDTLNLVAEYPDTFPYFPPQVVLDGPGLSRHHHPLGKNLCLLARGGEDWQPGEDTLAVLLRDQLPRLQAINAAELSSAFVAENEDHVGEPFSSFLPYPPNCTIIVPDQAPPPEHASGRLALKVRPVPKQLADTPFINGVVQTVTDLKRRPLVEFSTTVPAFSEALTGFWMRLPDRPRPSDGLRFEKYFLDLMTTNVPEFKKALETARRGQVLVAGFVYPDETAWRRSSDDWVFLAVRVHREAKGTRPALVQQQFIPANWGGEEAWMRRAPALRPLRTKSALVVGLGSLGSPLALQLARAGIQQLYLVDCDELQVGNTIRWALGWQHAGFAKVSALDEHLRNEYPYTNVTSYYARIGVPSQPNDIFFSDYDLIRSVGEKVDLIIDAAATHRVSHFLADLAQELRKPYLWLTTTHGAAGGVVGRILPGKTAGCWHCFQRNLADNSMRLPADTGSDEIQPGGCSQPTFIGAGIDSDEVALLASRLAVATLCSGQPGGYSDFAWDVAVGDFTRGDASIVPEWTPYPLLVNPTCPACNPG